MKRTWDIEELIEHFTLLPQDMDLLANKTENTFMELGSPDGNTSQHLKRTHPQPTDPRW